MRQLKFRAWGDYNHLDHKDMIFDFGYVRAEDGVAIEWVETSREDWIVMQYTGLKDKNNKEIYEGDVLKDYGKVEFIDSAFVIGGDYPLHQVVNTYHPPNYSKVELEVIGNIYENPELLKESK